MRVTLLNPKGTPPTLEVLSKKLMLDEDMVEEFEPIYNEAVSLAQPRMLYGKCYVAREDDGKTVCVGEMRFQSRVLHRNMENITAAFPYVATGGRELHELAASKSDPLEKFWVDAIAEAYLGVCLGQGMLEVKKREGTGTLYAMNPGSLPDWPLSQQRPLFALLGDVMGQIGVELTDSFLMLPVKSVSGLLFESAVHYTNCSLCPREGCVNRREPFDAKLYTEKYQLGEA